MIFLYDNKVIDSTINRSSERSAYEFDVALPDPRLTRVGRTSTATDEWVSFNLGAAEQVDYMIIAAHNFTSGATVVLEGNDTADFTTPAVSYSLTVDDVIIQEVDEEYQFWRITFSDSTDYCQIGYVFIGPGSVGPGMERSQVFKRGTTSEYSKSRTMQIYGEKRTQYKAADITFPLVSEDERAAVNTVYDYTDIVTPFIILFWENSLDVEPPLYCNFTAVPEFARVQTAGVYWSMKISIEECK